jgi:hypothetical protein
MTDLETAILDVLRKVRPSALTLTDVHAKLIERGWAVHAVLPRHITDALISLEDAGHVRNELSWHALAHAGADALEAKS